MNRKIEEILLTSYGPRHPDTGEMIKVTFEVLEMFGADGKCLLSVQRPGIELRNWFYERGADTSDGEDMSLNSETVYVSGLAEKDVLFAYMHWHAFE